MGVIQQFVPVKRTVAGGGGGGAIIWMNVVGASEVDGLLTKDTGNNQWGDCGAVSVENFPGDCRLTYYWENDAPFENLKMIGLSTETSCVTFSTIDRGMNLEQSVVDSDDAQIAVYHNGGQVGATANTQVAQEEHTGAMLEFERVGGDIIYYFLAYTGARPSPGDPGRTSIDLGITSTGDLYVHVAIFGNGKHFDAVDIIFTEI